jgi:hypothetical protein
MVTFGRWLALATDQLQVKFLLGFHIFVIFYRGLNPRVLLFATIPRC